MFGNAVIGLCVAIASIWSFAYLVVKAERADAVESAAVHQVHQVSQENYICVIPDYDQNLPCRVMMREDIYIQHEIELAPKD